MKATKIQRSDSSSSNSSNSFIKRKGEGDFLSPSKNDEKPFISPSPSLVQNKPIVDKPKDKNEKDADDTADNELEQAEASNSDASFQQELPENQTIQSKPINQEITSTGNGGKSIIQRSLKEEGRPRHRFHLVVGDTGPGVSLLQFRLNALHFDVPVSARFDRATTRALRRFHNSELVGIMSASSIGPASRQAQRGNEVDNFTWEVIDRFTSGDTGSGVSNGQIRNSGTSSQGNQLGFHRTLWYALNGVEISFGLSPDVSSSYRDLRPRQWLGPEAQYIKSRGSSSWERTELNPVESGADDPAPELWQVTSDSLVFYDSPGPQLGDILSRHPNFSHVRVIQNFSCWAEGRDIRTRRPIRLSEAFSWHSIIDIHRDSRGSITSGPQTEAGTGWRNTDPPS